MRPPKRIDRTPRKASTPTGRTRTFRKGRSFVPPEDVELDEAVSLDEPVSPLPTAGDSPQKWELRSGIPAKRTDDEPVIDLRSGDSPTVDLRTTVRIVDGDYFERRTSGFKSRWQPARTS